MISILTLKNIKLRGSFLRCLSVLGFAIGLVLCARAENTVTHVEPFDTSVTINAKLIRTLKGPDGQPMRGTRMVIGKPYRAGSGQATTEQTVTPAAWGALKAKGLNTVRVVWIDPYVISDPDWGPKPGAWWTVDEMLPYLDRAVTIAQDQKMNIIINYHHVAEYRRTGKFDLMEEFWQKVAPRYKDNPYVFYELNNEQAWSEEAYLSSDFMSNMKRIYTGVRKAAPERVVIMFSFNSLSLDMHRIVSAYSWLDFSKTFIGFHLYGNQGMSIDNEHKNLKALLEAYPVICTEWDYPDTEPYVKAFFGKRMGAELLEELGVSWIDWRPWNDLTTEKIDKVLLPHAHKKQYWWGS